MNYEISILILSLTVFFVLVCCLLAILKIESQHLKELMKEMDEHSESIKRNIANINEIRDMSMLIGEFCAESSNIELLHKVNKYYKFYTVKEEVSK